MSGKPVLLIIIILSFFNFLNAEIIKISKLKKKNPVFCVKRNIFFPDKSKVGNAFRKLEDKPKIQAKKEETKKNLENEIKDSVFFEGYVFKKHAIYALMSGNGEFYIVKNGDVVLEKIKIINVNKKMLLIEVESIELKILLKGAKND